MDLRNEHPNNTNWFKTKNLAGPKQKVTLHCTSTHNYTYIDGNFWKSIDQSQFFVK